MQGINSAAWYTLASKNGLLEAQVNMNGPGGSVTTNVSSFACGSMQGK